MLSSLESQGCNTLGFYLSHRIVGREGEFENLKKKLLLIFFCVQTFYKYHLKHWLAFCKVYLWYRFAIWSLFEGYRLLHMISATPAIRTSTEPLDYWKIVEKTLQRLEKRLNDKVPSLRLLACGMHKHQIEDHHSNKVHRPRWPKSHGCFIIDNHSLRIKLRVSFWILGVGFHFFSLTSSYCHF